MAKDQGDGVDELLENERCVEADDENDLVDQELRLADEELRLVWEDDREDDNGEKDSDSNVEPEYQSLFLQCCTFILID